MQVCNRLGRPEGLTVIATINRTLLAWLTAIVGAEYVLRWLPRGTHRYCRLVRPRKLQDLLEADGLAVTYRVGVAVSPFTRRFRYTRRLAVNYMLSARRPPA